MTVAAFIYSTKAELDGTVRPLVASGGLDVLCGGFAPLGARPAGIVDHRLPGDSVEELSQASAPLRINRFDPPHTPIEMRTKIR